MTNDLYRLRSLIEHCMYKLAAILTNVTNDERLIPPEGYLYEAEQTAKLLLEQLDTTLTSQKNALESLRDYGQL